MKSECFGRETSRFWCCKNFMTRQHQITAAIIDMTKCIASLTKQQCEHAQLKQPLSFNPAQIDMTHKIWSHLLVECNNRNLQRKWVGSLPELIRWFGIEERYFWFSLTRGSPPQVRHCSPAFDFWGHPELLRPAGLSAPHQPNSAPQQPLLHHRMGSHFQWVDVDGSRQCRCFLGLKLSVSHLPDLTLRSRRQPLRSAEAGLPASGRPQDLHQLRLVGQHGQDHHGVRWWWRRGWMQCKSPPERTRN